MVPWLSRRRRRRLYADQTPKLIPIARLWIWRMLMKLDMRKDFVQISECGDSVEVEFGNDTLAEALGLKDAPSNVF